MSRLTCCLQRLSLPPPPQLKPLTFSNQTGDTKGSPVWGCRRPALHGAYFDQGLFRLGDFEEKNPVKFPRFLVPDGGRRLRPDSACWLYVRWRNVDRKADHLDRQIPMADNVVPICVALVGCAKVECLRMRDAFLLFKLFGRLFDLIDLGG